MSDDRLEVSVLVRPRQPLPDATELARSAPLSREDFADRYGARPEDLATVEDFARSAGLEVLDADPARRTVRLAGSASQMESAFGVTLATTPGPDGTDYRAPDREPTLPAQLQDVVEGVFGLDSRPVARSRTQ